MTLPQPEVLEELVKAAFRTEWGAVVKATTAASTVAVVADASGGRYVRSTGSWLDEGYDAGDELTVAGYTAPSNNGVKRVEFVSATDLVTDDPAMVNEAAGSAVTLGMTLPSRQKLGGIIMDADPRFPWLAESFAPADIRAASIAIIKGRPLQRMTGLYWLRIMYPVGCGDSGISRLRGKIISQIYAGRSLVYQGHTIRIKTASPKPFIEQGDWTSGAVVWAFQADALNQL